MYVCVCFLILNLNYILYVCPFCFYGRIGKKMGCNGSAQGSFSSEQKNSPSKALTVKIILLGDSGVGKSALLQRYASREIILNDNYITTIGMDFQVIPKTVNSIPMSLNICDTCGQERFKAIARPYYRDIHSVLLVYDVTSKTSFEAIESWVNEIKQYSNKELSEISMTLIANKCDLQANRKVTGPEGERLAQQLGAFYIETSAKSKEPTNTDIAFETSLSVICQRRKTSVDKLQRPSACVSIRSECQIKSSCGT